MPRPTTWAVWLLSLLGLHYLVWRLTATLNLAGTAAAILSLTALAAELILLASFQLQLLFSLWPSLPQDLPAAAEGYCPSIDVLVPSCGEPLALVERCLRGCLALDAPRHRVWLLDDSGRPELQRLCEALGVSYLARTDRRHAKAGNLNHALQHCSGELIAVFDADVVPLEGFLHQTVPLLADPRVGFVQTPQSYMNADAVMRNLALERWLMPDEECFYRWIEPCREAVGAVVCAGTSFVMRREALDRVGGFETGTPSEDLATGIRITAAGYRNRFLDRKLSAGLAPFTVAAMVRQRCRWASGTVQVLRTGANPLTIPGLGPLQRLAYLEGIGHWFTVMPQLLLVLLPLATGLLGISPLQVSAEGLLQHALPFYGAQLLLARWISRQSRTALLPELYRWIFLVPLAGAVLATLAGRPQPFRVTPKEQPGDRGARVPAAVLLPLVLLLSLQLVGLVALLLPARGIQLAPFSQATLTLTLSWILTNGLLIALAMRACRQRPGLSPCPWFSLALACPLHPGPGSEAWPAQQVTVTAISEEGLELVLPGGQGWRGPAAGPEGLIFSVALPALGWLPLRIEAQQRQGRGRAGRIRIGARLDGLTTEQRDALQSWLYRREGLWPRRRAPLEPLALLVVLGRLLTACPGEDWFRRSLVPQSAPGVQRPKLL